VAWKALEERRTPPRPRVYSFNGYSDPLDAGIDPDAPEGRENDRRQTDEKAIQARTMAAREGEGTHDSKRGCDHGEIETTYEANSVPWMFTPALQE
jgi:hypothetical protein